MKIALLISVLLSTGAAGGATPSLADAQVLHLKEVDVDSNAVEITANIAIVDIGSTIHIGVTRDNALAKLGMAAGATELTATLVKNSKVLADALAQANKATEQLRIAMHLWTSNPTPETLKALQDATGKAADPAFNIVAAATSGSRFENVLDAALEAVPPEGISDPELFRLIADAAAAELVSLQADLRQSLQEEGVYFMLGAWIVGKDGNRSVHLDGFDDIKPSERYVLDRWSILLTPEQQSQLDAAGKAAHLFNSEGAGALVQRTGLPMILSAFNRAAQSLESTDKSAQNVATTVGGLSTAIQAELIQTATEMRQYRAFLEGLMRKYQAATPAPDSGATLLAGFNADLRESIVRARELVRRVSNLQVGLAALPGSLGPPLQELDKALRLTVTVLKADIDGLAEGVAALFSLARVNAELLEFSKEVKRHSVASLPSATVLDLNNTGRREPGDAVVFRFAVGRGESKPTVVETRQLTMYRVLPHFDTTVGLIFARVPDAVEGSSRFQAAPAYSVLLKWGSRTESYVNSIVTPGLGLNLSALDFNRDNTPEVGVALTLSLFRNILQAGGGYNVFRDQWYFFFGVGLPMPNIGGLPTNASSSLPDP
ncbi:hypothetical protein [Myxococcus xanthus]|uniref:Uncharacterized protein n=1 Tax=Myxococcus xanthus TaxID=34 RepID=A0A7Y4IL05_MYXXA|nr:hypothetical protein [Myxococcus xanthus]NOJ80500.1 hypothetical protein [Myxococcus xanthus]NOJ87516.1 hypothetical protein [Myxococcus xanthus]